MLASSATSCRRRPGVRRRGPSASPTSAGRTWPRRCRRNAASSARLVCSTSPRIADSGRLEHGTGDTSLNEALPPPAPACDRAGMSETSEKKIVLITGANKGIGFATAAALGRSGHTVLLGARDSERGATAARQLAARGLDARFVRLDVTDAATITSAAALIDADYGRLDILGNNA